MVTVFDTVPSSGAPCCMTFADDAISVYEHKRRVERGNLERMREVLVKNGLKIIRVKTEYIRV